MLDKKIDLVDTEGWILPKLKTNHILLYAGQINRINVEPITGGYQGIFSIEKRIDHVEIGQIILMSEGIGIDIRTCCPPEMIFVYPRQLYDYKFISQRIIGLKNENR